MTQIVSSLPETIRWRDDRLFLLDQTRLPLEEIVEEQKTVKDVWQAIKLLKVRGAPAIGVAAAYGLCLAMKDKTALPMQPFMKELEQQAAYLDSSRPTAVNLGWALRRLLKTAQIHSTSSVQVLYENLLLEAQAIHAEDQRLCVAMGEFGAPLIRSGMGVLTFCNAGALATSGIGTATAPMYLAHSRGKAFRVYACETRPLLQGARITSWELQKSGLDVVLNTDNAAAHLMSQGLIDIVIVGTDRVAANGDVANKIGTLGIAILSQYYRIPFYVACPSSTYDPFTPSGEEIVIEEREPTEVTEFAMHRIAPSTIQARNPAFDVTPAALVTGLITEKGIIESPYLEKIQATLD